MFQKIELQQLQQLSLDKVKEHKVNALKRKAELEGIKAKGGKAWTQNLQEELDDLALYLVDVDDIITVKEEAVAPKKEGYTVPKGTEKMVHLSIVRGRRFNPLTGKEESNPYTQMFTYGEWMLFKKNFKSLGYTILKVLHDPYGEASALETKIK